MAKNLEYITESDVTWVANVATVVFNANNNFPNGAFMEYAPDKKNVVLEISLDSDLIVYEDGIDVYEGGLPFESKIRLRALKITRSSIQTQFRLILKVF